jgi:hypothetical protein
VIPTPCGQRLPLPSPAPSDAMLRLPQPGERAQWRCHEFGAGLGAVLTANPSNAGSGVTAALTTTRPTWGTPPHAPQPLQLASAQSSRAGQLTPHASSRSWWQRSFAFSPSQDSPVRRRERLRTPRCPRSAALRVLAACSPPRPVHGRARRRPTSTVGIAATLPAPAVSTSVSVRISTPSSQQIRVRRCVSA